jgi:hypothetical protein
MSGKHEGARGLLSGRAMLGARMTIVASSRETRDGMHTYLSRLGAEVRSTAELARTAELSKSTHVLIVFADDYARDAAARAVRQVRAASPKCGVIVVTRDEAALRHALGPDEQATGITFLCRPVWGWAMADAIRNQVAKRRPKRDG